MAGGTNRAPTKGTVGVGQRRDLLRHLLAADRGGRRRRDLRQRLARRLLGIRRGHNDALRLPVPGLNHDRRRNPQSLGKPGKIDAHFVVKAVDAAQRERELLAAAGRHPVATGNRDVEIRRGRSHR